MVTSLRVGVCAWACKALPRADSEAMAAHAARGATAAATALPENGWFMMTSLNRQGTAKRRLTVRCMATSGDSASQGWAARIEQRRPAGECLALEDGHHKC